jgi:Tfp pilus assembly protein PilV
MFEKRGFSMIEALIASSICLMVFLGVAIAFRMTVKAAFNNTARLQAAYLEEEGQEAVRILRDNGWTTNIASHSSGTTFYLTWDGSTWNATSTKTYVDSFFERSVVLNDVYRNSSQDIVTNGGTLDPKTKKATVSVLWRENGATTTRSLATYLTNIFNN